MTARSRRPSRTTRATRSPTSPPADLDGDDDLDIVAATQGDYINEENIDLFLNDGSGKFTRTSLKVGDDPTNLALADLDDDGDIDIVMANSGYREDIDPGDGGIGVLINNGDATFAPEVRYQVGPQTYEVVLADVDGDGQLDAVATNYDFDADQPHLLSVLPGNGDGTFDLDPTPTVLDGTIVGSWGQAAMDAGDLDGDGDVDLALGGTSSFNNAVLTNDGSGEFTVDATYEVFGAISIRLVDADDDDDLDVLSVGGGGGTAGHFTIQRNNGDGTLAAPRSASRATTRSGSRSATSTATAGSTSRSRTGTPRPARPTSSARTARSPLRRPAASSRRRRTSRPLTWTAMATSTSRARARTASTTSSGST